MQQSFRDLFNIDLPFLRGSKPRSLKQPLGYKLERCLENIDNSLICMLCQRLVKHPIECNSCKVLFCRKCLEFNFTAFFFSLNLFECSACRCRVPLKEPSRTSLKKFKRIRLKCKYDGCMQYHSINRINSHQLNCEFKIVACQAKNCSRTGVIKDFFKDPIQALGNTKILTCSKRCQKIAEFEVKILFENKASVLSNYFALLSQIGSYNS